MRDPCIEVIRGKIRDLPKKDHIELQQVLFMLLWEIEELKKKSTVTRLREQGRARRKRSDLTECCALLILGFIILILVIIAQVMKNA